MGPLVRKICLTVFAVLLLSCSPRDRYVAITGYAQGGTYTVKLNLKGVGVRPEVLRDGIDSILTRIDTTLSGYNKGSQLSRFNRGESIEPNDMFRDIFLAAKAYREETDGALDVAAAPLFDAWGFGFSTDSLPSDETVEALRKACDMDRIPEDLTHGAGQRLNYNAIAPGPSPWTSPSTATMTRAPTSRPAGIQTAVRAESSLPGTTASSICATAGNTPIPSIRERAGPWSITCSVPPSWHLRPWMRTPMRPTAWSSGSKKPAPSSKGGRISKDISFTMRTAS